MSNKKFPLKLTINPWRIILIFSLTFVALEAIFYSIFTPWYIGCFNPFDMEKAGIWIYIYTPVLLVLAVVFCVLSITKTYYEIDGLKISHYKMGHCDEYMFSNIIYIEEEWSKKHKMLSFYLKDGRNRTLAFDKEGLIFKYAMEKSNLISKEEFKARFPKARIS